MAAANIDTEIVLPNLARTCGVGGRMSKSKMFFLYLSVLCFVLSLLIQDANTLFVDDPWEAVANLADYDTIR
jgi:hypothetical protein